MRAPRRIIVGIDGSEDSKRALDWGIALLEAAKGSENEIIAVHVLGLLTHLGGAAEVRRRDTEGK